MKVLLALGFLCDDEGASSLSVAIIAARAGVSERAARYAIRELLRDGFLSMRTKSGRGHTNQYRINLSTLATPVSDRAQPAQIPARGRQNESAERLGRRLQPRITRGHVAPATSVAHVAQTVQSSIEDRRSRLKQIMLRPRNLFPTLLQD